MYSATVEHIPVQVLRKALLQEDHDGFRPLELASRFATCGLFQSFFCTKGVYITREASQDLCTRQYFDITDYESTNGSRRLKSPLILLGRCLLLGCPCLLLTILSERQKGRSLALQSKNSGVSFEEHAMMAIPMEDCCRFIKFSLFQECLTRGL